MKATVVLDWDGVIFDDDKYKEAMFKSLSSFGLKLGDVEAAYESSKDHNGFNDRRLARMVAERTGNRYDMVLATLDEVTSLVKDEFVFEDARRFLNDIRGSYHVVVLTAGDDRIQRAKIRASGLEALLDDTVVVPAQDTERNKADVLHSFCMNQELVVFYDDRLSTIIHLHETFHSAKNLIPVYVHRDPVQLDETHQVRVVPELRIDALKRHIEASTYGQEK